MDYSAIVVWKHAIVCFTIVLREQAYYCVLLHGAAEYLSPMVVNKRFQHTAAFWMHICGNVLEHKDASLLAAWCPRSLPMALQLNTVSTSPVFSYSLLEFHCTTPFLLVFLLLHWPWPSPLPTPWKPTPLYAPPPISPRLPFPHLLLRLLGREEAGDQWGKCMAVELRGGCEPHTTAASQARRPGCWWWWGHPGRGAPLGATMAVTMTLEEEFPLPPHPSPATTDTHTNLPTRSS